MILMTRLRTYIYALSLILVSVSCQQGNWQTKESLKTEREGINQAAPANYVVIGDSTGLGIGARNGHGYVALLLVEFKKSIQRCIWSIYVQPMLQAQTY